MWSRFFERRPCKRNFWEGFHPGKCFFKAPPVILPATRNTPMRGVPISSAFPCPTTKPSSLSRPFWKPPHAASATAGAPSTRPQPSRLSAREVRPKPAPSMNQAQRVRYPPTPRPRFPNRTWGTLRGCSVRGNGNTGRFGLQRELQEKELGIPDNLPPESNSLLGTGPPSMTVSALSRDTSSERAASGSLSSFLEGTLSSSRPRPAS